jgi:hypothetical protein
MRLLLLSQGRNLEDAAFKVNKKMRDFPASTFKWNRKATGKACATGFWVTWQAEVPLGLRDASCLPEPPFTFLKPGIETHSKSSFCHELWQSL